MTPHLRSARKHLERKTVWVSTWPGSPMISPITLAPNLHFHGQYSMLLSPLEVFPLALGLESYRSTPAWPPCILSHLLLLSLFVSPLSSPPYSVHFMLLLAALISHACAYTFHTYIHTYMSTIYIHIYICIYIICSMSGRVAYI